MKRVLFFLIIIALCPIAVVSLQPAYALDAGIYNALHEGTSVYADKNFDSAILISLDKDTEVEVIRNENSESINWCLVSVDSCTGYVPAYNLYQKTFKQSYTISYAKITSDKKGEDIFLYASPSIDSAKLATLHDGARILLTGAVSGDYLEVEYHGVRGYVPASSVTRGITYHQYLALVVGIICFAAVVAVLGLAYYNNRKKVK